MPPISRDVLVIGGGPAGSSTAIFLARHGYRVTLLERSVFPRVKPCGDYLTPGAVRLLRDELGVLPELLAAGAVPVTRETVVTHRGATITGETAGLACSRSVTDFVLLRAAMAAGVEVREGVSVREIVTEAGAVVGVEADVDGERRSFRATVTVGADGTRSLVARKMGVVLPIRRLQRVALVAAFGHTDPAVEGDRMIPPLTPPSKGGGYDNAQLYHCVSGCASGAMPVALDRHADPDVASVTMYLPVGGSDGCCGVGPVCGETRNVNIVVPVSEARRIAGRPREYFEDRLRRSFPTVWDEIAMSSEIRDLRSIGCFGHRCERSVCPGAALVGDAAMFIHPFTGEGVYFGLRGGQMLAEAIHAALSTGHEAHPLLTSYDAARRQELAPRYRLCDAVQRVVHCPSALAWAAGRLNRSPRLTDLLLRAVGDVAAPRDLWRPWALRTAFGTF
jgi:flavin-dependent dehydrogenase